MAYVSLYKLEKERDRLERKLDRLTDPAKVLETYKRIAELEKEIEDRLSYQGARR